MDISANTTYCLGYWYIENNVKHDINHYLRLMPKTLKMLGDNRIVFYYSHNDILEHVKKNLETNKFVSHKVGVCDLPTFEISKHYMESCKNQDNEYLTRLNDRYEKGLVHFYRDYKNSGESSFRKLFSIWTSKLFLMEEVIKRNPFDTKYFAWVDVSVSRCNHKRENWNFMKRMYSDRCIHHYDNSMSYYGEKLNLSAGFMLGHERVWLELFPLYKDKLENLKNSNYAHDEETIINRIYRDNPDLFCRIGKDVSRLRKLIMLVTRT